MTEQTAESYVWQGLDLFERYGDAEAIVTDDERITYTELRRRIFTMATALHQAGVRSGDGVAVLVGTPPEAVYLQFALHLLGCRSVWIAPNTPPKFRIAYLEAAGVNTFVHEARHQVAMVAEMTEALPQLRVFGLGPHTTGTDLLTAPLVDEPPISRHDLVDAPQSVFQTGGTTGQPKLVHHGHVFFQTLAVLSAAWIEAGEHYLSHLACSGYWHVSGQTPALMTLFTGGKFVPQEGFNIERVLAAVERERITSLFVPPPLLYQLLDDPRLATADVSSLQMLSVGGAAAAPARLLEAIERFGPIIRPVYGMTEASFISAYPRMQYDPEHPDRIGSCGQPYGNMVLEIRGPDQAVLPTGQVGEVWLQGGLMMTGYWGQPELTRQTLADGWLRTGDVGYLDEDGYLYLVDRVKDMIITGLGSTNVYARPIEDVLLAHPQVRAAAIVGVPDVAEGEAVHAYVVPAPDATVTPEQLREHVVAELNDRWSPREVQFVDELPLTAVGKVDKKALRARYLAERGVDGSSWPRVPGASTNVQ